MLTKSRARPLLIGALSERTGVNVETIRYYERSGLLPAPPRTQGRHRSYDERHVQCLEFIRRSRELGFSLDDIRTLFRLAREQDTACGTVKDVAMRHLADVSGKIASLRKLERALKDMTNACAPGEQVSCPIIETLAGSPKSA